MGIQKFQDLGAIFLAAVREWLSQHPKLEFPEEAKPQGPPPRPKTKTEGISETALTSINLYQEGKTVEQIAELRTLKATTINGHIAQGIQCGKLKASPRDFYTEAEEAQIAAANAQHGHEKLAPIFESLGGRVSYEKIRFFMAFNFPVKESE